MTKRKRTKGQTTIYKTLHRKLRCSREVSSSCSTSGIRRIALVTNPEISHEKRIWEYH